MSCSFGFGTIPVMKAPQKKFLLIVATLLCLCFSVSIFAQETRIVWKPVASGIWSARIGAPEALDLLKTAGIKPNTEALTKLGAAKIPWQFQVVR